MMHYLSASPLNTFLDSLGTSAVGFAIVFVGLIFLICLVAVMGTICQNLLSDDKKKKAPSTSAPAAPVAAAPAVIENRDELVVAFSAAVAEELGTDVSAIRVVSLKEIG